MLDILLACAFLESCCTETLTRRSDVNNKNTVHCKKTEEIFVHHTSV